MDEEKVVASQEDSEDSASDPELPEAEYDDEPSSHGDDDREKALRDRLSVAGRESARLRRENEELRRQIIDLQQRVLAVQQHLQEQERKRWEAYIASLPPAEQALERVKMLEAAQQRQAAPASVAKSAGEDPIAYKNRRMREILNDVNSTFNLVGDDAIVGDEDELDDSTEQAFIASAYKLAARRASMARRPQTAKKDSDGLDKVAEEAARRALEALGVNAPLSARSSAKPAKVSSEDIKEALWSYNPRRGAVHVRKKLEELRESMS